MRNELRVLYLVFQNMFAYNLMVFVAFNTCNTYMLSNRGGCGLVSGNKCFLFRTYSPRVFWGHQMDRRSHQAGQMENVGVHLPIFFEFVYFPKPTYQIYTATGCLMTLWFFLKRMKIYLVYTDEKKYIQRLAFAQAHANMYVCRNMHYTNFFKWFELQSISEFTTAL